MTRYARHYRRDDLRERAAGILARRAPADDRDELIATLTEMVRPHEIHVRLGSASAMRWIAGDAPTHARLRYLAATAAARLGAVVVLFDRETELHRTK